MKLLRLIIISLVSLSLIVLSGCNKNDVLSKDDEKALSKLENSDYKCDDSLKEQYNRKFDIISKSEPVSINWEETKMSKANYWFDKSIDLSKRKSYIKDTMDILTELNKRYNKDKTYNFYISDKVISHNDGKNIYIQYNSEKFDSSDFIIQALYSTFGDTSNYGLIYGEMMDIQKNLKIGEKLDLVYNKDYIEKQITKKPEMLDLTLPVFLDIYNSSMDIDYMKSLSIDFVSYVKGKHGEKEFVKLLDSSSEFKLDYDDKFVKYMNEFLKHKKLNVTKEKETFAYRYKIYNDKEFPICVCTKWMNYCFDPNLNTLDTSITDAICDYRGAKYEVTYPLIKKVIAQYDKDMSDVRKFLGSNIDLVDDKDIITYFTNEKYVIDLPINNAAGYYTTVGNYIYCISKECYLHEYTHYLTLHNKKVNKAPNNEYVEGIAELCEYKFAGNTDWQNIEYEYDVYGFRYKLDMKTQFNSYLDSIGMTEHNKSIFDTEDRRLDFNDMIYCKNSVEQDSIYGVSDADIYPYVNGCAFARYLVDNYGIDKYMQLFNDYSTFNFKEIYGINENQMKDKCLEYIKNKYQNFI